MLLFTGIDRAVLAWLELGTRHAFTGAVTQRNVETLIGRLVTNPAARRRFATDPAAVLREFEEAGYELTDIEFDALAATNADAIRSFAESIDRRIRRADPGSDAGRVR